MSEQNRDRPGKASEEERDRGSRRRETDSGSQPGPRRGADDQTQSDAGLTGAEGPREAPAREEEEEEEEQEEEQKEEEEGR